MYPDRVEIHNPGNFPIGVTPQNIIYSSIRRNEHLCKVAYDLMLMEKEGSGWDVIFEDQLSNGKKVPVPREEYDRVIYTFDTHNENYLETLEGAKLPIKHCIKGTNGHMLYGKVVDYLSKAEAIFEKDTFPSLELANYLKEHPADVVEVCGLVSNICVLSNVVMIKAALPNARIIVNKNLTDSFDKKLNAETFDILEGLHIEVME
jgi:hypothetical protein